MRYTPKQVSCFFLFFFSFFILFTSLFRHLQSDLYCLRATHLHKRYFVRTDCVPDTMGIQRSCPLMSYPIKQDLKLPGDIGGLNGSGNAKGFLRVDPEAFHSPLAQNKVTAKGGRWIWSKLGGPAMVLAPPETALAVLFRVVSSPGRKQLRNV